MDVGDTGAQSGPGRVWRAVTTIIWMSGVVWLPVTGDGGAWCLFAVSAGVTWGVAVGIGMADGGRGGSLRAEGRGVLLVTLALVGAAGWLAGVGVAGLVLLVVLALGRDRRWAGWISRPDASTAPLALTDRLLGDQLLGDLSIDDLIGLWGHTDLRTHFCDDQHARALVVAVRCEYLDELERRDPCGVRRWLDADPLGGADLGAYLTRSV